MKQHSNILSLLLIALLSGSCTAVASKKKVVKLEEKSKSAFLIETKEDEVFWGRELGIMNSLSLPMPPPTDGMPTGSPPTPAPMAIPTCDVEVSPIECANVSSTYGETLLTYDSSC